MPVPGAVLSRIGGVVASSSGMTPTLTGEEIGTPTAPEP